MKNEMEIKIENIIREAAPGLRLAVITADVVNGDTPDGLWNELVAAGEKMRQLYKLNEVNQRPAIAATRKAYKALGKDPNRYRPSSDALTRRMVKGMGLYRISTLVDLINVVSLLSGHSIGGFDLDKIAGDTLALGAGHEDEEFQAIHRGDLNISHLPIYRDAKGGIGTPTSDCERTSMTMDTRRALLIINCYGEGEITLEESAELAVRLLNQYANGRNVEVQIVENVG